ncbi:hypothetical protein HMPREF1318_2441 [Actinomyces massiliensis F0489]|uniref:Uncharacterized protein n=1 Tax=Actinomyces massiliensis F0489 TaxID=1125718 RepID=J0NN23_9ACTO|nr:hypothetical protein HMPREF1318_2441 [Actinomyces massiliensis F0489]
MLVRVIAHGGSLRFFDSWADDGVRRRGCERRRDVPHPIMPHLWR